MTTDELRVKVAEAMGWKKMPGDNGYWSPDTGGAPPKWGPLPPLSHWFREMVIGLAGERCEFGWDGNHYGVTKPLGHKYIDVVSFNTYPDHAVAEAWLRVIGGKR